MFALTADGQATWLGAVAPPLGWCDDTIDESVMIWKPGSRLFFVTDGVVDARDGSGDRLTEAAVLRTLSQMSHGETPDDILEAVFAQLNGPWGARPSGETVRWS